MNGGIFQIGRSHHFYHPNRLSPFYHHMNRVSVRLPQLLPDDLQQADNIADVPLLVLQTHIDDAALIGQPIKENADLYPSGPELFPDVQGKTT